MIIKRLILVLLFFQSLFKFGNEVVAQSALSKVRIQKPDSALYYSFPFQLASPVDSNSNEGLMFILLSDQNIGPVIFYLTTAGAILCISDSVNPKPIPVERRNYYPFHSWQMGEKTAVQIWKTNGNEGFARCRWINLGNNRILDEVFVCLPAINCAFKKPKTKKEGHFKIR